MLLNINVMDYIYQKKTDELEMVNVTYRRLDAILRSIVEYFEDCYFAPELSVNYKTHDCSVVINTNSRITVMISRKNSSIEIMLVYKQTPVTTYLVEHINDISCQIICGPVRDDVVKKADLHAVVDNISECVSEACASVHREIIKESENCHTKVSGKRVNAKEW